MLPQSAAQLPSKTTTTEKEEDEEKKCAAWHYVVPRWVKERLEGWKQAVADGHEIANHSIGHPCTGNFRWVREDGVEVELYTLEQIRAELGAPSS